MGVSGCNSLVPCVGLGATASCENMNSIEFESVMDSIVILIYSHLIRILSEFCMTMQ
jgi:hypothetical protein